MSKKEYKVVDIQSKLEKIIDSGSGEDQALGLLKELEKLQMNLNILTNTKIVKTVNVMRKKSKNDDVIRLGKVLLKNWQKFTKEPPTESSVEQSTSSSSTSSSNIRPTPVRPSSSLDSVRQKCREMLFKAIKGDGTPVEGGDNPQYLAQELEECIHNEFRNTNTKYMNKIRSRVSNLRDARNPNLRLKFLCRDISPRRLANMTSEDMASDEMKAMRKQFTNDTIKQSQLPREEGTKTVDLKCDKCGNRNCTYSQYHTRSVDHPMTTFVTCNDCGNTWYFEA